MSEEIRKIVRDGYTRIAKQESPCCSPASSNTSSKAILNISNRIGYTKEELGAVPEGANLGLGCGNPVAFASLKEGETVLDLGAGGGFDCFLAAAKVGPNGKIIGVDMTPEMVEKARDNARKNGIVNVEFRLGEIENLPVQENSVDAVISNCVINLSPDKTSVFREVYRVLKPGGRIAISDIALLKELPEKIQKSPEGYVGCISGATLIEEYKRIVEASGLKDVKIAIKGFSACIDPNTEDPMGKTLLDGLGEHESLEDYVASVYVEGHKQ